MPIYLLRGPLFYIVCTALFAACPTLAQEHKHDEAPHEDLARAVHEKLAVLPSHGVFDMLTFEVQGRSVTLSGQVLKESVKQSAEHAVKRINGVESVVNRIEVLPTSRRDDSLRMDMYRAIYEKEPLEKYGTRAAPSIHIVVKNGSVTLEGVVDSDEDRSLVRLRALKVSPQVSEHLRVAREEER